MDKIWIRRDRETGEETEVTAGYVQIKLVTYYIDVELAMTKASKDNCLTTGFADYYPKS